MKITLKSWPEKVEIADNHDYFNATDYIPVKFNRTDDALRWLRPHIAEALTMKKLRQLLASENISHTEAMSSQQVIQKVAELIFQGKLILVKTSLMKIQPVIIEYTKKAAPVEAAPAAPPPQTQEPVIEPEPEEEDNTDHAAQAETLKSAAEEGAPFCEECEKAKQQNAA